MLDLSLPPEISNTLQGYIPYFFLLLGPKSLFLSSLGPKLGFHFTKIILYGGVYPTLFLKLGPKTPFLSGLGPNVGKRGAKSILPHT